MFAFQRNISHPACQSCSPLNKGKDVIKQGIKYQTNLFSIFSQAYYEFKFLLSQLKQHTIVLQKVLSAILRGSSLR